jgi:hypothetical protein
MTETAAPTPRNAAPSSGRSASRTPARRSAACSRSPCRLRAAETGASAKVADFLLAWWNGDECGHFPVLHLCNVDAVIAEDMLTIMAYLAQESTTYADAWGYRDAMHDLWVRYRGDPAESV